MPDLPGSRIQAALRKRLDDGGRAFVPYVTGGLPGVDAALLRDLQETGADAVEVGIPFSDPVMDGGVIQESSRLALRTGATPASILRMIEEAALDVPVAVMTYLNPIFRTGFDAFLEAAQDARVAGAIVPDLPIDEADEWIGVCRKHGVASVQLAAPGTSQERLSRIAAASQGFVYCVATYGVTGARDSVAGEARELVERVRPLTDLPLLVGVGVGTPDQATLVASFADGVIVGSALMARLLESGPEGVIDSARAFRAALPLN